MKTFVVCFALTSILVTSATTANTQSSRDESGDKKRFERFEKRVHELRAILKVPGMSAVIVKDQKVRWTAGSGFADVEKQTSAMPNTLFHIASLTKTFGATLIMQLVEQGKLSLDEPASRYSTDFKDDSVKIKHLLTHTSSGKPGDRFQYDGRNYDYVDAVLEKKTGKKFTQLVVETFFDPLEMTDSVPYHNVVVDADKWMTLLGQERLDRYKKNLEKFAEPYSYYGAGEIIHTSYPGRHYNGSAAGLLSTALDMAKYDIAIDRHQFIKKETQEHAWTPFVSNSGARLPHGLGWFATNYHGVRLIWHYGHWGSGFSALYLKVPEKDLTLIMLANSESLVDHQFDERAMTAKVIVDNVFACSFLDAWDLGYGCEKNSQAAMKKWIAKRRASGKVAIKVSPEVLESYVGEYQFETLRNRIFIVTREGDKLLVQEPPGKGFQVFAESETKFFLKDRTWGLEFTPKSGAQPAQLKIVQGKDAFLSKRIK
ncbi:MAG TPA: serine hydrolase domain-containing protein [Pyrinomonadaceae bacterium]